MSWEHSKYEARCENCGKAGFCIRSEDDWGRSNTSWIGFETRQPDPTAVGRKRTGPKDLVPICTCKVSSIAVGKYLGACDGAGQLLKA